MGKTPATIRRRRPSVPPEPIVNLATLPAVLTLREMSAVFRVSPLTIRRRLAVNDFLPLPFEKYPYRWRREDVIRYLNGPTGKLRTRKHGFAATKARQESEALTTDH